MQLCTSKGGMSSAPSTEFEEKPVRHRLRLAAAEAVSRSVFETPVSRQLVSPQRDHRIQQADRICHIGGEATVQALRLITESRVKYHWSTMNENLRSVLVGTAGLSAGAIVALLLAILRRPVDGDVVGRERTARLFLIGLAAQCLHFVEEFVTRFQDRFPALFGLPAWSEIFFVVFNLIWLSVWILSAIGLQRGHRFAMFPVWFFAIAAMVNGIAHPVLAVVARGYFPGLISSPVLGVLGVLLWIRLQGLTRSSA